MGAVAATFLPFLLVLVVLGMSILTYRRADGPQQSDRRPWTRTNLILAGVIALFMGLGFSVLAVLALAKGPWWFAVWMVGLACSLLTLAAAARKRMQVLG